MAQILYPNQVQAQFGYFDASGDFRLKTLNHLDPLNRLLTGHRYAYDAEGQITNWQRTGIDVAEESFSYDAAGQLIEATTPRGHHVGEDDDPERHRHMRGHGHDKQTGFGHHHRGKGKHKHGKGHHKDDEDDDQNSVVTHYRYAYDAAGNRTEETVSGQTAVAAYNDLNQLLTVNEDRYSYDADGNLIERHSVGLDDRHYVWDAENRLIAIDEASRRSDFQYDAFGRRILIQDRVGGLITPDARLIYCGLTLCAKEDRLAGTVTRYYGDGESRAGAGRYYNRDHLGSIRAVTDATGTLTAAYRYDPYGRRTALLGKTSDMDFGYTGHYVHPPSGLALAPYRAYDAEIGRWLSRDPIEENGGENLYANVDNNPMTRIDPRGLESTLITTFDYGFGSHSALYINTPGQPLVLYDPAGSYTPKSGEARGSGDLFEGEDASLQDYIDYQKSTGSEVSTTQIPSTPEHEQAIKEGAEDQGGAGPGFCASAVSSALGGVCGILPSAFPGKLERNAKNAKCQ